MENIFVHYKQNLEAIKENLDRSYYIKFSNFSRTQYVINKPKRITSNETK